MTPVEIKLEVEELATDIAKGGSIMKLEEEIDEVVEEVAEATKADIAIEDIQEIE